MATASSGQLQGDGDPPAQLQHDGLARPERFPGVEAHQPREERHVLDVVRPVEAELRGGAACTSCALAAGARVAAQEHLGDVPRRHAHDHEHDDRHARSGGTVAIRSGRRRYRDMPLEESRGLSRRSSRIQEVATGEEARRGPRPPPKPPPRNRCAGEAGARTVAHIARAFSPTGSSPSAGPARPARGSRPGSGCSAAGSCARRRSRDTTSPGSPARPS